MQPTRRYQASADDRAFRADLEACRVLPTDFDHRAHLRLGYVYLTEQDDEGATRSMREALQRFLRHNAIDPAKYHETLTHAWILAMRHFMRASGGTSSASEFIDRNARLLDPRIMKTHYSSELLDSAAARIGFVEPNLSPIPRYDRHSERTI